MYDPAADPDLRVVRTLGEGGTAMVVQAHHHSLKRDVAVKYGRPPSPTEAVVFPDLARREYDLIGSYRFPGLVRMLLPLPDDQDHLVLELCSGPTLSDVGQIGDVRLALDLLSAVAADLEFLRAAGLIHGDLKPQNIFLPRGWEAFRAGQLFYAKLSDFSLGRRLDEPESVRLGLGTVGFMAPETILHRRTSLRSDLFALGVIAYTLLGERHPFMDDDTEPVRVNSRVCEQEPTSLKELRPDLSEGVCRLVERLLSKSEEARPESGWEVCEALQREGATYPYRHVLRPAFLIRDDAKCSHDIDTLFSLTDKEREQVDRLTEEDTGLLRLLVSGNFDRQRLIYDNGRFRFCGDIYWPSRLRRQVLSRLSRATWRERKSAIITAIVGEAGEADELGLSSDTARASLRRSLPLLLLPLLTPRTVKRISSGLAPAAERHKAYATATRLHLQAGNLAEAERCAELAAHELMRLDRKSEALSVTLAVDRQARMLGREFDIRRVILLKGNVHKDCGELDVAETAYLRLIRLYDGRSPDKLLGETHKYLGEVYRMRQDTKTALESLERSLAVFKELGEELETSHTLTNIGNVHWIANDIRRALRHYRTAYKIQERLDAKPDLASTLHNIATMYCFDGRFKRGILLLNRALRLKKEIGNLGEIARTLNNLGYVYQMIGSPAKAAESLTESLEINRRIGSKKELLYNLENLVSLKIAAGQLADSKTFLTEGLSLSDSHRLASHAGTFHLYSATIARRQGRYADAEGDLARVDQLLETLDDRSLGLLAAVQKASLRLALGDGASSLEIARQAYNEAIQTRNSVVELDSLLLLVRLTDDDNYWQAAQTIVTNRRLVGEKRILSFGRAERLIDQGRIHDAVTTVGIDLQGLKNAEQDLELPWMRIQAARLCIEQGDSGCALRMLQAAQGQAQNSELRPELITSLTLLGQVAHAKGDYEKAYASFKQALSVCREVASSIPKETDRELYLGRPEVRILTQGIKSLSQRLGQKARADR